MMVLTAFNVPLALYTPPPWPTWATPAAPGVAPPPPLPWLLTSAWLKAIVLFFRFTVTGWVAWRPAPWDTPSAPPSPPRPSRAPPSLRPLLPPSAPRPLVVELPERVELERLKVVSVARTPPP